MKKLIAIALCVLLLAGCAAEGGTKSAAVDVNALYAELEAVGMPQMLELDENMRLNLYGIKAADVKQAKVAVASDGLRADEIWLIEAVSAEAAQKIATLAHNRVKQKDAESITYSPEQNVIVKKSLVKAEGNYVIFLCSPDVEKMTVFVNAALGK
jgi:hypothetical protein